MELTLPYLQQSLGIDFRDRTLRIVHLGRTFKGIVLVDYFLKKYPPAPAQTGKSGVESEPDPLALDLRNFIRERGVKPDQIIVGLPKDKVTLKEIILPKVEEKQLQEILEYEVERHIPFTSQSISFDYQVLNKEENALKVLLAIAKKDELQKIVNLLDLEHPKPFVVDIASIAGTNWLISRNGLSEGSITAVVDIGVDSVDICLLSGKEVRITRSFSRTENRLEDAYLVEDAYEEDEAVSPIETSGQAAGGQTTGQSVAGEPVMPTVPADTGGGASLPDISDIPGIPGLSGIPDIDDEAKSSDSGESWLENEHFTMPHSVVFPSPITPPSSGTPSSPPSFPFPMSEEGQDEGMFPDLDKQAFPSLQHPGAEEIHAVESMEEPYAFESIDESVRALGQDIIRELDIAMNVFNDVQEEKTIDTLVLTGTEAYTGFLAEYLKARTGAAVRILNPLKNIKTRSMPGKISSSLSVATGLALRGLEDQPLMLNFLAEGEKIQRKTNQVVATGVLMALIVILSLAWVLGLSHENKLVSAELTRRLQSLQPDVNEVKNISQEVEKVDKELSMIEKFTEAETSKMEIIKELTTILPADTWLDNLDVSNEKLEINGYSESASNLIPMLEISPLFENVQFGSSITKMGPGKERFKITASIEKRKSADSTGKEKGGKEKKTGPENDHASGQPNGQDKAPAAEQGKGPAQEKKTVPEQGKGPDLEKKTIPDAGKSPDQGKSPGAEKGIETGKGKSAGHGKKVKP